MFPPHYIYWPYYSSLFSNSASPHFSLSPYQVASIPHDHQLRKASIKRQEGEKSILHLSPQGDSRLEQSGILKRVKDQEKKTCLELHSEKGIRNFKCEKSVRSRRQKKGQKLEQKKGRNSYSNLLRMFFRKLQNVTVNHPQAITRIIEKFQLQITLQIFLEWLQKNKIDFRNYVRVSSIRKLFIDQGFTRQHAKIMRVLLKEFIDKEVIIGYLTSKRAKRGAVSHEFGSFRHIIKEILD